MDSTGYYLTWVVSIITERYRLRTRWIVFATASSLWARLGENTARQAWTKRKNGERARSWQASGLGFRS